MRKSTILAIAALFATAASASAVDYTLSPAPGAATDLMTIELNFPNDYVVFYENQRAPIASLENTTTGAVYYCQDADRNTNAQATTGYSLTFIGENDTEAMPINEPGEYTLTIKGMYLTDADDSMLDDVPVITANYTIAYPVKFNLTPAAGTKVTDLAKISIEFPDNRNVEFYENNRMPVVVLENLTNGAMYTCAEPTRNTFATTNGIIYDFTFTADGENDVEEFITGVGEYKLTVKALALNDDGEYTDLPVITAFYEIAYPIDYVLTPDPKTPATDLMTIGLEFPKNKNVGFYENNRTPVAVLEDLTNGKTYVAQEADRNTTAMTDGICYSFTFVEEDAEEAGPITAPGNYLLTIKAFGYEDENGVIAEQLPVIIANYTIEYPIDYILYPLGNVASNLKTVAIEFPNNKVDFYDNMTPGVATLENITNGKTYLCKEADIDRNGMTETGCAYTFTFIDYDTDEEFPAAVDITEPGDYVLTIRGAKYLVDIENEEYEDLPWITKGYTINYPYEYYLEPEDGAVVKDLTEINLTFTSDKVVFYENNDFPLVILTNVETEEEFTCNEPTRNTFVSTEGTSWTFRFVDEEGEDAIITQSGHYTLTVKGMYVEVLDDELNVVDMIDAPNIYASYEIGFPIDYILNPTSGSTVDDLRTITIEFPDTKNVVFYENNRMNVATLENTTTGTIYNCLEAERNPFAMTEGIQYILNFVEEGEEETLYIASDGAYTLTIMALAMTDENDEIVGDLPTITAEYYIVDSGVKAAELINADSYNVYTVNGMQVVSNGSADSLRGLDSGLYIINGKKVFVRK